MWGWVALVVPILVACGSKAPSPQPHDDDAAVAARDPWAVPDPLHHVVLRPRFVVGGAPFEAGSAFAIRVKDRGPLLVTAQHLFGPDGGLDHTIAWRDMPREVSSVAARSVEDDTVIATGGAPVAIEGAEGLSDQRVSGDVAAFPITNLGGVTTLDLAASPPRPGSRVALIAKLVDGTTSIRHGATVFEDPGDGIYYMFDTPLALRATSGAPVVDGDERVVAINLGGGTTTDGHVFGIGNSVAVFWPAIQRALPSR